ncbi:MAG: hypothetical protein IJA75_09145 [Oscillospiraceae bacterium]|nr:hypothetical protein [Oscillospiraceae bacterium]
MIDWFIMMFSDELLSQGVRIGGILYLPAHAMFEEILCLLVPVFCFAMVISLGYVFGKFLYLLVRALISGIRSLFRHKAMEELF